MSSARAILSRFLPFWLFLSVFKFGGGLHYTLMSPYGEQFLPVWIVGTLIGGAGLLQLMLDVPAGYLLDRVGYVPMLKFSTVLFLLAGACLALGLTQTTYLVSLGLAIIGWLFYGPGGSAYIMSHSTNDESGRYFSLRDTFASIGIVLGSIALPFVILASPRSAGGLLCILFLIALGLLYFIPAEAPRPHVPMRHHARRETMHNILKSLGRLNPASGMLLLLSFAGAIFYAAIWFVVPLIIAGQAQSGLLSIGLGIFDFSVVVLGYFLGVMADRTNKRTMVFFGLLIFSLFAMLVGLNFGWLFILFGFLATAGEEMAGISLWSWMHHLDRDHTQDGVVVSVVNLFDDLGWAVGPVVAGILYSWIGPAWAITLAALPIFIVWLVYYLFVHRHFPYEIAYTLIPHRYRGRKHKS